MRNCLIAVGGVLLCVGTWGTAVAADPPLHATSVVRVNSRNGRLVRHIVAPPVRWKRADGTRLLSFSEALRKGGKLDEFIREAAARHQVDPLLIRSVIEVESNYDPFAISPRGAEGLMQLVPSTARQYGVKNSFDPQQNIEAGVRHLKYLQTVFREERLVLAAYNAGEAAVAKYHNVPPYPETRQYVKLVGVKYAKLKEKARQGSEISSTGRARTHYRPVEVFIDAEGRLNLRTR